MDAVRVVVINIEELEFVNELPVAPQMSVSGGAKPWGLSVGEVGLHVDERAEA